MQSTLRRRTADSTKEKLEKQVFERHDLLTRRQMIAYINSFIVTMTDSTEGKWKSQQFADQVSVKTTHFFASLL